MNVMLKVLTGSSAGKELRLKPGEFFIGRGDGCHLRPKSDAISRKHCVLRILDDRVSIEDLKSRNGTIVNGDKVEGDHVLKSGDRLAVGPLEFEIVLQSAPQTAEPSAAPQAKVAPRESEPAKQAERRKKETAAARGDSLVDDDIFGWLSEADEVERAERMHDPGTRQFKMADAEAAETTDTQAVDAAGANDTSVVGKKEKKKKEKKEPGKLPPVPEKKLENSQQAAAETLRQFFRRQ
ncbi:MAG: FHA domain-containing protein [Planctomycetales bacterium]|nr:FHA domain-containing protein [Planctomycetales bacterium]